MMAENDTPEARLEAFCQAMETDDLTLIPTVYVVADGPQPMVADLRAVLAKLKEPD